MGAAIFCWRGWIVRGFFFRGNFNVILKFPKPLCLCRPLLSPLLNEIEFHEDKEQHPPPQPSGRITEEEDAVTYVMLYRAIAFAITSRQGIANVSPDKDKDNHP